MRDVTPNLLWIGNTHDARDVRGVMAKGIAAVIDLAMEEPPVQFPRDVVYCRFPLIDGEGNSPVLLRSAIDATANFIAADLPTLVACSNGMSRSPAIVSAALAKLESLDFDTSIERVASTGPCDLSPTLWAEVREVLGAADQTIRREYLTATISAFESNKRLADRAVEQVSDEKLHVALDDSTNSIAVIMKHVAGNLLSRWTDFLTTDGEKRWRNRDEEFIDSFGSRAEALGYWNRGWTCLFDSLHSLMPEDLGKTVFIRGEPHSVPLAIQRSLGHTCYHIGQIVQIARIHAGDHWQTLTIPKGGSEKFNNDNWGTLERSDS